MKDVKLLIIEYLKEGLNQKEISEKLMENEIFPNSLSSVEKKIKNLRDEYGAKTLFHLAIILYENGVI